MAVRTKGKRAQKWKRGEAQRLRQTKYLGTAEWIVAGVLTATILFLLAVRAQHAGALWRDECGAVQLARMPTFADVIANFQFEAFPLLFPAIIRTMTNLFGTSDAVFRIFGFLVGVLLLAVIWLNARQLSKSPPLLSLALNGICW